MVESIGRLTGTGLVLDLGGTNGNNGVDAHQIVKARVDLRPQQSIPGYFFVQANAERLPFRPGSFDTVVCNHSLEHFSRLEEILGQIGAVVKPDGALFITMPDVRSFTDRAYRWLARGNGHGNGSHSAHDLAQLIESRTGLPHIATRTLCTSLSFVNRRNAQGPLPGRLAVFLWGMEGPLILFNALLRLLDRFLHTRTSVYGWALYFGLIHRQISRDPQTNVCVRCGYGHPSDWLRKIRAVDTFLGMIPRYRCPHCGVANIYFRDESYKDLQ
jgi:SAM-dependent methyltransferase